MFHINVLWIPILLSLILANKSTAPRTLIKRTYIILDAWNKYIAHIWNAISPGCTWSCKPSDAQKTKTQDRKKTTFFVRIPSHPRREHTAAVTALPRPTLRWYRKHSTKISAAVPITKDTNTPSHICHENGIAGKYSPDSSLHEICADVVWHYSGEGLLFVLTAVSAQCT